MEPNEFTPPPLTIHQLWIGEELGEEDNRRYVEKAIKVCGRAAYMYKLWKIDDLISSFPHDSVFYLWHRLWNTIPYPPILAASVDYFKWKILSTTPENERAIFMDLDVEMMEREGETFEMPLSDSHIAFGQSSGGEVPTSSFLHVYGPTAANIAILEADKRLSHVDMDSPTFFEDFLTSCINGQRNSDLSLGALWIQEHLLPRLEEMELSAELVPLEVFSHFGQYATPLFLHHERHFSTAGNKGAEEIAEYRKVTLEQAKRVSSKYLADRKKVIVCMSTAKSYEENLKRTLGLITAKDIRDVQRRTTFGILEKYPAVDYFFIVGKGDVVDTEEAAGPDFYYAKAEEGREWMARRFYDFIQWVAFRSNYEFLFFCEDDNYIHIPRLFSYCLTKQAGEMNVYGNEDEDGNLTHAGILVPAAVARKIRLEDLDPPKEGEDFGSWLKHAITSLDGEFILDDKFSWGKGQYPAPTNGRITTHDVNPYDLVALAGMNTGKED